MGKINGCLKCLFIFFNVVFAIFGCLLIYAASKASVYSSQLLVVGNPSLGWFWVFAITFLAISCLGIYAGCSEKGLALKIFAGFMGVGMVIMFILGIIAAVARNKMKDGLESIASEVTKELMANEGMRHLLDGFQQTIHCCGLTSANNWGNDIPDSCACTPDTRYASYGPFKPSGCKSRPQGTSGPAQIYEQSCGDFIFAWIDFFFKIILGIFFGFAVVALLGLLVSVLMIHQVKRHDNMGGASIAMKGY